jgi:pilus assembly protein Flp/PilA
LTRLSINLRKSLSNKHGLPGQDRQCRGPRVGGDHERFFVNSHKFWFPRLLVLRAVPVDLRALKSNNNQEVELKRTVLSFLSDESGATAIEYGLIAAGISLAIIAIVNGLGANINTKFTDINSSLK